MFEPFYAFYCSDSIVQWVCWLFLEQEVGCHMTSKPTHALCGQLTPTQKKKKRKKSWWQIVRTGARKNWEISRSTCGQVGYYRRNLWTDTGTAAPGLVHAKSTRNYHRLTHLALRISDLVVMELKPHILVMKKLCLKMWAELSNKQPQSMMTTHTHTHGSISHLTQLSLVLPGCTCSHGGHPGY